MTRPLITNYAQWMREMERRDRMNRMGRRRFVELQKEIEDGTGGVGDQRVPTAPIELVPGTDIYVDTAGKQRGIITLSFPPVTKATDATDIDVGLYEMWVLLVDPGGVLIDGQKWRRVSTSLTPDLFANDLEVAWYNVRARAFATSSPQPGQWSATTTVQILPDTTPPPIPSPPTVTVNLAAHHVRWDGTMAGGLPIPPDFFRVEIAYGTEPAPEDIFGVMLSGPATLVNGNAPYDTPIYYRARSVDHAGNVSGWSDAASATSTPLVSADVSDLESWFTARDMSVAGSKAAWDAAELHADQVRTQANSDILAALTKTDIVYSDTEPAGDADTVWIDTTGETEIAMVWNGIAWVTADDEAVNQALLSAQLAEQSAIEAQLRYEAALDEATISLQGTMAEITYSPLEPSGMGNSEGHTWFQRDGSGNVIGQWKWDDSGATWEPVQVTSEVIANLDVGKLVATAASIDTLVAQQIAAASGEFIDLVAENFSSNLITADFIDVGSLSVSTAFIDAVQSMGVVIVDEEGSVVINLSGQGDINTRGIVLQDENGLPSASMSASTGLVYGRTVVAETIELAGDDLTTRLDAMARGAVVRGAIATGGRTALASSTVDAHIELLEMALDVEAGRTYLFVIPPIGVYCGQEVYTRLFVEYTTDGSKPYPSDGDNRFSTPLGIARSRHDGNRTMYSLGGSYAHTPSTTRTDRYLLWIHGSTSGDPSRISIFDSTSGGSTYVEIFDMGRRDIATNGATNRTGIQSDDGSSNPPAPDPVKEYKTTWTATAHRTFFENGGHDTGTQGTGNPLVGDSPYTSGGSRRAQILFPNPASTLSGATIKKVEVYLYAEHWHYNSGGSTAMRYSGDSSLRGTLTNSYITDRPYVGETSFGKPQGKWINLSSSHFANVKAGNMTSVLLYAPGFSNSASYYGYFSHAGDGSRAPKIRVTYEK